MSMTGRRKNIIGFLAPQDRLPELLKEVDGYILEIYGNLVICDHHAPTPYWVQNIWHDPLYIDVTSIKDAAKKLRDLQRNWCYYSFDFHGRARLIQENLPHVSAKPIVFFSEKPTAPMGNWCLIDKDTIIAATHCSSPYPNGIVNFVENKDIPPTRAYLKLWEAFTHIGRIPQKGDKCIDVGACPGGWSWVLHETGADVIAVDKAPLDKKIAKLPRIEFLQESAFGLNPEKIGQVDWFCSDIICYPDRLIRLIEKWKNGGYAKNMICTLKLQGETDFNAIHQLAALDPQAELIHLYNNKHELTWIWQSKT